MSLSLHAGKAAKASRRILGWWTLICLLAAFGGGFMAVVVGLAAALAPTAVAILWLLFIGFILYFFRDPNPQPPTDPAVIVAAGHGKVDHIDEIDEPEFMGGRCHRVSVFLSVFDVHVQNAPVAGTVAFIRHQPGKFINALKVESAACNENVLIGLQSSERPGEKIAVRLIAGLIARRIVPWVTSGDTVERGQRISLIQFGSRCDHYLPLTAKIEVQCGDRVRAGETVIARR